MCATLLNTKSFRVTGKNPISLKEFNPASTGDYTTKDTAEYQLKRDTEMLSKLQYRLYAENRRSLLIIFQAMDAAGKDGAIKHVFSGVNPQGCEVTSFKKPSVDELDHDYFWRHYSHIPARGNFGIFNRSHYENVLVTKVHPQFLMGEMLPGVFSVNDIDNEFWEMRYKQIRNFEKTTTENGTTILKFFLHLSKDEQRRRFLSRIDDPEKNWKISSADIEERKYWDDYQKAYEEAINKTATEFAPWFIIPADHKWFSRMLIGHIIVETLTAMDIKMPEISAKEREKLQEIKESLV